MRNFRYASQYLAKIAASSDFEDVDYRAEDNDRSADKGGGFWEGVGTAAGGYAGWKYGDRLAGKLYTKGTDLRLKKHLKDLYARSKDLAIAGRQAAGNRIADAGMKIYDKGLGLKGKELMARKDFLTRTGDKVAGLGEKISKVKRPNLNKVLKGNASSLNGSLGVRAKYLKAHKGALPKKWKWGGKVLGGIGGAIVGNTVGYGLDQLRNA